MKRKHWFVHCRGNARRGFRPQNRGWTYWCSMRASWCPHWTRGRPTASKCRWARTTWVTSCWRGCWCRCWSARPWKTAQTCVLWPCPALHTTLLPSLCDWTISTGSGSPSLLPQKLITNPSWPTFISPENWAKDWNLMAFAHILYIQVMIQNINLIRNTVF